MNRLKFTKTPFDGLLLIERVPLSDHRGFFSRIYCNDELNNAGIDFNIRQINHSYTKSRGTIRGMHFQSPPYSEAKIISCIQGSIFDVAVDIRKESLTYMKWYGIYLNEGDSKSILIPKGFAHGFQTLADNTHLIYLHSNSFHENSENGINPFDPVIGILWPEETSNMSERDKEFPMIANNIKPNYEM